MKVLGIIPARYYSSRFPGKPLADILGKTMIRRVYERASELIEDVIVATDNDKIADEVNVFNGKYILTSKKHKSGTDRCAEALRKYEVLSGKQFDIVINIQGDEPFIHKEHLEKIIHCFEKEEIEIATLVKVITEPKDIFNPDTVKVLRNIDKFALYFSRSPVPFIRGSKEGEWHVHHNFLKHIGIYAYKKDVLFSITKLAQSTLEKAESLEQNRWIENGFSVYTELTDKESHSVDTKEDLQKIIKIYS